MDQFVFMFGVLRRLGDETLTHLAQPLLSHRFGQIPAVEAMWLAPSARVQPVFDSLLPAYRKSAYSIKARQTWLDERFDADSDQSGNENYFENSCAQQNDGGKRQYDEDALPGFT